MSTHRLPRGFTLIELMVALVLLAAAGLGLSTTLASTRNALSLSERQMQAVQLAAEGMEQLHAGHALGPIRVPGDFERAVLVTPWGDHPGLQRVQVTVSWNDGEGHTLNLMTLVRR